MQVSGEVKGFSEGPEGPQWIRIRPGDVFHVAGGARHAFRNLFDKPSVAVIVTTSNLGRFFQEIGERKLPEADLPGSPSQETLRRFLEVSEKYGYWNAT